jgi:hypothetical protein
MKRHTYVVLHHSVTIDELKRALMFTGISVDVDPSHDIAVIQSAPRSRPATEDLPAFLRPQCGPTHDLVSTVEEELI